MKRKKYIAVMWWIISFTLALLLLSIFNPVSAAEYEINHNDYRLWATKVTKSIVPKSDIFKEVTDTSSIKGYNIKKYITFISLLNKTYTSGSFVVEIGDDWITRDFIFDLKNETIIDYNRTPINLSKYKKIKTNKLYNVILTSTQYEKFMEFLFQR